MVSKKRNHIQVIFLITIDLFIYLGFFSIFQLNNFCLNAFTCIFARRFCYRKCKYAEHIVITDMVKNIFFNLLYFFN